MKKIVYTTVLISFLFLIINPFTYAGVMDVEKEDGYFIITNVDSIPTIDVPNVVLDNITGDLNILGGYNKVILLQRIRLLTLSEAKAQELVGKYKAVVDKKGSTIKITGRDNIRKVSISYILKLPKVSNIKVKAAGSDVSLIMLDGEIDVNTSGGDIESEKIGGEIFLRTSGGDIYVKDSFGDVELSTSGGDIEIENIDGDISSHTSGGDIICRKANGYVRASTSGGDIKFRYCMGKRIEARTSGGDIKIDGRLKSATLRTSGGDIYVDTVNNYGEIIASGGDIIVNYSSGDLYLHTSGGDIQVKNSEGSIDAMTSGGDVEVSKLPDKDSSIKSGKITTSGGNIVFRIKPNSKATIKAEVKVRKRYRDDCGIISDFPINLSVESSGDYVVKRGTVLLNGGGNIIELKTTGGDIIIEEF
ncbi:MAG: hypothetical protein H0Z29_07405 [Candidatus Marinimicrobia bacterium]|nr:hypothetical protein [Candidatus Neomarinimicrobiota bacterium]